MSSKMLKVMAVLVALFKKNIMKFSFRTIKIKDLVQLISDDKMDLKPHYQRNDIWTRRDQESLIDSILKGYPLPSFFIYKNNQIYEMVDGQQRARTIYRYINKEITDSNKNFFNSSLEFLDYELSVTELFTTNESEEIEEFYVLVNKKGKHLTTPELHKAEFSKTNFLRLNEELLTYQNFMNLNLFTERSSVRMSDRNFVEELVAYLINGINDKKTIIEEIYSEDISDEDFEGLSNRFRAIIDRIQYLNEYVEINKSRYKQKNDFYTLFNFIDQNLEESNELLMRQYKILLAISSYISPSNEDCLSLREYALNCVSQSNSKKARAERLYFFNALLLNKNKTISENKILADVSEFVDSHELFNVKFEQLEEFYLLNV